MLSDAADAMLEIANGLREGGEDGPTGREVFACNLLTKKAWWLVGQEEVTRRRVVQGYRLDNKDRKTILAAMASRETEEDNGRDGIAENGRR